METVLLSWWVSPTPGLYYDDPYLEMPSIGRLYSRPFYNFLVELDAVMAPVCTEVDLRLIDEVLKLLAGCRLRTHSLLLKSNFLAE